MKPPLLPFETLERVLRVARFDGRTVLGVAGLCALLSAVYGSTQSALICLVISGAGAVELHGVSLLQRGERGMAWLIWSQVILLVTIIGYAAANFLHPSVEILNLVKATTAVPPDLEEQLKAGGMTLYYVRRRAVVDSALEDPEVL
jgi:hypothetical protein